MLKSKDMITPKFNAHFLNFNNPLPIMKSRMDNTTADNVNKIRGVNLPLLIISALGTANIIINKNKAINWYPLATTLSQSILFLFIIPPA